jgi:hypothetical protein
MKLSKKWQFIIVAMISSVLTFIACGGNHGSGNGGGNGGGTPGASQPSLAIGIVAGTHVYAAKKTTSFNFSIVPRANAQVTTTVALSQSWNGACNFSPGGLTQPSSFFVYGLGQTTSQNCSNEWFNETDGTVGIANAQVGQLVIGNGTITNLVAWTSKGTVLTTTGSGVVRIGVLRGSQKIDTGIRCTLGQGSDYVKCQSTSTFQANDGDLVFALVNVTAGDSITGLNVVFTKA